MYTDKNNSIFRELEKSLRFYQKRLFKYGAVNAIIDIQFRMK